METNPKAGSPRKWTITLLIAVTVAVLALVWIGGGDFLSGDSNTASLNRQASLVFTPAHSSLGVAAMHFFGIRREPEQPIAYTHKPHIEAAELQCDFCHTGVAQGPSAGIPGVKTCMVCHESIATERPEIQKMTEFYKRGEDIPWERVYGWNEEAHVRFVHAPHIRAEIECAACHGDVARMTVARRVVDHSMDFCVGCHQQRQASNDCLTCHY